MSILESGCNKDPIGVAIDSAEEVFDPLADSEKVSVAYLGSKSGGHHGR